MSDFFIVKPAGAGGHWSRSHECVRSRLIGLSQRQGCLSGFAFCDLIGIALRAAQLGSAPERLAAQSLIYHHFAKYLHLFLGIEIAVWTVLAHKAAKQLSKLNF